MLSREYGWLYFAVTRIRQCVEMANAANILPEEIIGYDFYQIHRACVSMISVKLIAHITRTGASF